jgi:hypothetical protein
MHGTKALVLMVFVVAIVLVSGYVGKQMLVRSTIPPLDGVAKETTDEARKAPQKSPESPLAAPKEGVREEGKQKYSKAEEKVQISKPGSTPVSASTDGRERKIKPVEDNKAYQAEVETSEQMHEQELSTLSREEIDAKMVNLENQADDLFAEATLLSEQGKMEQAMKLESKALQAVDQMVDFRLRAQELQLESQPLWEGRMLGKGSEMDQENERQ